MQPCAGKKIMPSKFAVFIVKEKRVVMGIVYPNPHKRCSFTGSKIMLAPGEIRTAEGAK